MHQIDAVLKKRLENKYGNEHVFVVPLAKTLHINNKFTEINQDLLCDSDMSVLLQWDDKGKFILRSDAEYNQSLQQLIPYVLILDSSGTRFYVTYKISGDERLTNTLSIGVGGHINPIDGTQNAVFKAFWRELNEEVFIKLKKKPIKLLGYVRDLSSPTKEHLGIVFAVTARHVKVKENTVLKGSWMSLQDLVRNYYKFESWARHIIDYLFITQQKNLPKSSN